MANKNERIAKEILEVIGGEENIVKSTHCATRLRLILKRSDPTANEKVKKIEGVVTVVENNGQFQVVIGNNVGDVHKAFDEMIGGSNKNQQQNETEDKGSILNRVIATMSAVFAPFIYILAAAGILQGLLILINLIAPSFSKTGTYEVFNFISWAPFTFLPIFIAITAAKHFNVNMYIAIACSAALVSPDFTAILDRIGDGETVRLFGMPLTETAYTSSVLPPLLLVWILSYLEKFLNKTIHEVVRPLFVPFLSIIIMVPVTLLVIGPISTLAAHGIANGYNSLVEVAPWLAGAIIGGVWQVFVIFGVHWGITPVVLANFEQHGSDSFQAYQTIAVIAQVGAVVGVFIKAKSQEVKRVSSSAGITGIFGITEPAIYGVNLRFKKPFIIACISGAIGAFVASFFNPKYYAYAGLPGPLTIVNGYNADNVSSIWGILIGTAIAIVLPIILIQIFGYGEDTTEQVETADANQSNAVVPNEKLEIEVYSPVSGNIVQLEKVPDPVFSEGLMGKGIAIEPKDNTIYSPVEGKVSMIAPSKHAIGINTLDGAEILIHIGLETVELNGEGFEVLVSEGDEISQGMPLIKFDKDSLEEKGYNTITPVIITNSAEFSEIIPVNNAKSNKGEVILNIIKI
ncbi:MULTISPECIES: beta-glucoside-specific PTS transporter subunit IIABC [Mammaliicoccus]|uniref:Beta-glucoside-specific PTS transporter subunit IIABC n=1 Tax=Mammaliicoccus fleurettii TaxID=150056 RepID=A0ABS5MMN9_9STAP|nr:MULTISPECIES: beta-glucoside-specific PTS transporter subunit IIABC [Mammaliicoccus]HCN60965.1 PTS beta-glucoside transporter subunit EIIBCA [Staphylococcus sp.]MBL0847204.1 PTS glucose transporter subunit IIA [Mammaliicoccus fleurettii]MBS3672150.1 beta-glucoside-specific PTS transporter subunit IIABC [Mammaliicoccus fleurettii]MBS3696954.1 beta-glucoside-specific PTS transporter subunit IIABC [Mammaliicoccus fleurettii]RTX85852.1 PTS beta-glucoside transporter subunit EIIBCA [Mammaliicocc